MPKTDRSDDGLNRRLAAILVADVVDFSRLMSLDEAATARGLQALQLKLGQFVKDFGGSVVDTAGDGLLASFPSAVRAVECAIAIQGALAESADQASDDPPMVLRIGINLGDVIQSGGRLFGDGVNIAARISELADPGGIAVTGTIRDQVDWKLAARFAFVGHQSLKNIDRVVPTFAICGERSVPAPRGAVPARSPSVAVLPFDNMSHDPADDVFSDGITEDITTELSRMKGFFVIARNTMFTYKGKAIDIRDVGRELGVGYILDGSVRKAGNRIRVTARLADALTGRHLWVERYDSTVHDIFDIQDEITRSVSARIGPELLAAEHTRAARKRPETLDSWENTLQGLFHASRMSEEDSQLALRFLDRALDSDPHMAQALGLKSWIVVWRAFQGWEDRADALEVAREASARAILEDEQEPWAWAGQGCVGLILRDKQLARHAFSRAIELNANFAMGHGLLGLATAFGGDGDGAIACIDQAVRLSPREFFLGAFAQQYAFAHFAARRHEHALECALKAHQLRPGHAYPMIVGAASASLVGDTAVAAMLLTRLRAVTSHVTRDWVEETAPYVQSEDRDRLVLGLSQAGLP